MIRASLSAGSRHASVLATPSVAKGVAFQRRATDGGLSVHTSGGAKAPPVWLRLTRVMNEVFAFSRADDADTWTMIGSQEFESLPDTVYVGLAVSSHVDGTLATARFEDVTIDEARWAFADIGSVGAPGNWSVSDEGWTIDASGADIWGTADAFGYLYRPWGSFGSITVRVKSIENTHQWAKAGIMFRDSLARDAIQVMAIVSPQRGVAMQYRAATGGTSQNAIVQRGSAPVWLRLAADGNNFTTYTSDDGVTWRIVGTATGTARPEWLHRAGRHQP